MKQKVVTVKTLIAVSVRCEITGHCDDTRLIADIGRVSDNSINLTRPTDKGIPLFGITELMLPDIIKEQIP